jgi:Tfp pilus assembly protein PilO
VRPFWRRRLLPAFWALLALNAAVYAAWTLPRTAQHRSIANRARTVRDELARERQRVGALQERAETITGNDADVRRFFARVGPKASLHQVQADINRAARDAGVTLGNRRYATKAVKGAPALARFEITMPAKGGYGEIAAFLDRVERMPHLVVVDRIGLRSGTAGAADPGQLEIGLVAYFQAEGADLAE